MLAAVRDNAVNLPLFLHVLGAMLLTGSVLTVAFALLSAGRAGADGKGLTRLGYRTVLLGAFPSYLLMRIGAQWTANEEGFGGDDDPAWIAVGYITADTGALLLLISMILSGIGLRRLRAGDRLGPRKTVAVLSILLLVAYLVAVWAMSAKPS